MNRTQSSLARATGQGWKVASGVLLLIVAGIATLILRLGSSETIVAASVVQVTSFVLGLTALWSVRCPKCHRSLGFWTFKRPVGPEGPAVVPSMPACPYCGYTPRDEGARGNPDRETQNR